jgi:hypothetical protein
MRRPRRNHTSAFKAREALRSKNGELISVKRPTKRASPGLVLVYKFNNALRLSEVDKQSMAIFDKALLTTFIFYLLVNRQIHFL